MAIFQIEFDEGETYQSFGGNIDIGIGVGYVSPQSYEIKDGFVAIDFGTAVRRIPLKRLIRITET